MPATTRNGAKQKRTHVDDPSETKAAVTSSKRRSSSINDTPRKRAAQPNHVQNSKAQDPSQKDISPPVEDESRSDQSNDEILINRAPVLELWAATVTSFLYPEVSWETSLSAGSAISTLCAISKGRTIGTIDKKDPATAGKQQRSKGDQLEDLEVMGLHLKLKDGHVLVGDKPKKANEQTLIKKFGEASYEHVKETFQNSLQLWSGQEDELNAQAFHHYEVFRPTVPKGQKGWGRKGNLNLQTVKDAVSPD